MRSALKNLLAPTVAVAAFGQLSGLHAADRPRLAEDARPGSVLSEAPAAPAFVGKSLVSGEQLQLGRRRIAEAPLPANSAKAPEPVVDPATPAESEEFKSPVVRRQFGGPAGRSAMHERLRARRLSRIQQMRQSADQNGDTQGVERAQYLEGMVNELHNQGLFSFAQKVMGAMQDGKLQGAAAGAGAATGAVEMPEAELGSPAPLPDADLGESAPLPGVGGDAPLDE